MTSKKDTSISAWRFRLNEIVEVGAAKDLTSRGYDFFSTFVLLVNITASVLLTFSRMEGAYGPLLRQVESLTAAFFVLDFVLRLISIRCQHPERSEGQAAWRYICSFYGLIDLLSFVPYYLPFFMPSGMVIFRMFRVMRIFRLFRLNAYYDALNVIMEVLSNKKQQLLSSVFVILVLMLASSMCMYSIENEAQPEVFSNAFSGIWWAVSTLLTVGYGDIYPITIVGRAFSIVITFLGVGMVAIPTGIISAGFVEQYSRLQKLGNFVGENSISFSQLRLVDGDPWADQRICDLKLPQNLTIVLIQRGKELIVPTGQVLVKSGDTLVLGAEALKSAMPLDFRRIQVVAGHEWDGELVRDLDISRQTFLVMVRRGEETLVPKGSTRLLAGDEVIAYHKNQR